MNSRTSESRVKSVIFDTNLQLLVLQKPRRTLLPSNPRSRNFEPPDKAQEVLRQKEVELQQSLEELRKLQATKDREEHKRVQEPSAAQELQLAKMARDLWKELEMNQLRESIRKLTEDYKSLQGPVAIRELRQAEIAHETNQVYPREAYKGPRATSRRGSRNFTTSQRSGKADRAIS